MLQKIFQTLEKLIPARWRWVFQHKGFKRYSANVSWLLFGQIFSAAVSFIVGIFVARQLGPASYGLLNYVISFITLFGFIASLGVYDIVKRELIGRNQVGTNKLLGTGWILCFIGSLLAIACLAITLFIIRQDSITSRLILLFSLIFIFQSFTVIDLFFQAQVRSSLSAMAQIGGTLVRSMGLIICLLVHWPLVYLVFAYLLGSVANQLLLIRYYHRYYGSWLGWQPEVRLAKKIISQSWPLILSSASLVIYARLDQILVRNMTGDMASGFYAVAVKLSEIWYFIPTLIVAALFPALVAARQSDIALYRQRLKRLIVFFLSLSVVLAAALSLLSRLIVTRLFGAEYLPAVPAMLVYNWTAVGFFMAVILNNYFIIETKTKLNFMVNGLAAAVNIGLNIILIRRYGIVGAAWATIGSYAVLLAVGYLSIKLSKKYVTTNAAVA